MPGQDILRLQSDCIRLKSIHAPFVLFNGKGFAECRWVNAHLGLFAFEETGPKPTIEAAMARDIPFEENEKCDLCRQPGAFDFMGDLLCHECVSAFMKQERLNEIRRIQDGEILDAFEKDRKEIHADHDALELSGGDLKQLDIEM